MADKKKLHRRQMVGEVMSDKMDKTVVVRVNRMFKHHLYEKYITRSKKFKAHDGKNSCHVGDIVSLVESRPLSRTKRWAVAKVIRKSKLAEIEATKSSRGGK